MSTRQLVLGTHNVKKGQELFELLRPHAFELLTLSEFENNIDVEETGQTFAENATLKATKQALHLGQWVLGEDSGLAVDHLEGHPGVYSSRFSGPYATDSSNNQKLLDELGTIPIEARTAHYVCHAVLSDPQGRVMAQSTGYCRGRIRFQASGTGGFGYDPLFEIVECHRTFGQLGTAVKALLSHRARAMRALVPDLVKLARSGDWQSVSA